ncbi:LysR family transcriptional regulator [Pseudoduganella lutea]|uniref:LysR family transcriptional regulator n=1 Tax=Pseudoduganella lutea TaxID=321985 RepID=A0A4P6L308_9BURK|nr:LysR family transcriptional regulator [Pseudoduganella lutea]QBE65821.1 LysR family transcriptional regulator [Pseudoduganella lutea]
MKLNLEEVGVFLAIVDTGSMTAAADRLGQPVSTVSRLLARLEGKLGTALLRRTTRRLDLTDEGSAFVPDARDIVAAVQSAEDRSMARRGNLSGQLRLDAATPFMLHVLVPLMPGYRARHPNVTLSLSSNEGFIDLLERRVDLAVRIGELKDSTLHSRLLGHSRIRMAATPGYLRRYGTPHDLPALLRHELLGFSEPQILNVWPLQDADGKPVRIVPTVLATSGETLRQLALQDMGIVCMADWMIADDIAGGRLVEVLPHLLTEVRRPIQAVYYRHSAVSAKIDSMVAYLAEALQEKEQAWLRRVGRPA